MKAASSVRTAEFDKQRQRFRPVGPVDVSANLAPRGARLDARGALCPASVSRACGAPGSDRTRAVDRRAMHAPGSDGLTRHRRPTTCQRSRPRQIGSATGPRPSAAAAAAAASQGASSRGRVSPSARRRMSSPVATAALCGCMPVPPAGRADRIRPRGAEGVRQQSLTRSFVVQAFHSDAAPGRSGAPSAVASCPPLGGAPPRGRARPVARCRGRPVAPGEALDAVEACADRPRPR